MGQMEITFNMRVETRSTHTVLVGKPPYAMKMEAAVPFETLVPVYQTTRCHIPDDCNPNIHNCENVKFLLYTCL